MAHRAPAGRLTGDLVKNKGNEDLTITPLLFFGVLRCNFEKNLKFRNFE